MSRLIEAYQVLEEYPKKDSTVDSGNLYFAATTYQEAFEESKLFIAQISKQEVHHRSGNKSTKLAVQAKELLKRWGK